MVKQITNMHDYDLNIDSKYMLYEDAHLYGWSISECLHDELASFDNNVVEFDNISNK
jgi:hypothetical protein